MVIRLVGVGARSSTGTSTSASRPALVDRHHPLAAVEGAFNAVMLQGDAIREITLEGPGAGGHRDGLGGDRRHGERDRDDGHGLSPERPRLARAAAARRRASNRSPFYFHLSVDDRPGVLARVADALAEREVSIARLLQHQNGDGAALHVVTHEARAGLARRGARRDRGDGRGAPRPAALPGRLRPRRRGARMGVIERYRDRLPVGARHAAADPRRGLDAAVRSRRLGERARRRALLQVRGDEPDRELQGPRHGRRGREGARGRAPTGVVCASTGNTAASAAAYAARAGHRRAVVLCPAGAIAAAKQAQSRAVGARVLEVRGSFDDALAACQELADRGDFALVNSLNPYRIEGQKTAAFEIVEELGRAPDVLALPYGGGGNTDRLREGLRRGRRARRASSPRRRRERATTLASAIRIAEPAHDAEVDELVARGPAEVVSVSDERDHATPGSSSRASKGIFCEPSSAAGLAALAQVELEPGSDRRLRPHRPRAEGHRRRRRAHRAARRLVEPDRRGRSSREVRPVSASLVRLARPPRPPTSARASTAPRRRSTSGTSSRSTDAATASRSSSSRARAPTSCRATPTTSRCARSRWSRRVEGHRFRFVNRIPLERGLGSRRRRSPPGSSPAAPSPGARSRRRAARARPAARRPRRQPRRGAARRRLPDLAERRRPARGADRRPTCRSRRSSSCPTSAREHARIARRGCPSTLTPRRGRAPPRRRPRCSAPRSPSGDADLLARRLPRPPARALPARRRAAPRRAAREPVAGAARRDALGLGPVGRRLGASKAMQVDAEAVAELGAPPARRARPSPLHDRRTNGAEAQ